MTYEFQASLYRDLDAMLDAIAVACLSANGLNDLDTQVSELAQFTDHELAAETIKEWGLDQADDYDDDAVSHMAENDYTIDDLAEAFGRLRNKITAAA